MTNVSSEFSLFYAFPSNYTSMALPVADHTERARSFNNEIVRRFIDAVQSMIIRPLEELRQRMTPLRDEIAARAELFSRYQHYLAKLKVIYDERDKTSSRGKRPDDIRIERNEAKLKEAVDAFYEQNTRCMNMMKSIYTSRLQLMSNLFSEFNDAHSDLSDDLVRFVTETSHAVTRSIEAPYDAETEYVQSLPPVPPPFWAGARRTSTVTIVGKGPKASLPPKAHAWQTMVRDSFSVGGNPEGLRLAQQGLNSSVHDGAIVSSLTAGNLAIHSNSRAMNHATSRMSGASDMEYILRMRQGMSIGQNGSLNQSGTFPNGSPASPATQSADWYSPGQSTVFPGGNTPADDFYAGRSPTLSQSRVFNANGSRDSSYGGLHGNHYPSYPGRVGPGSVSSNFQNQFHQSRTPSTSSYSRPLNQSHGQSHGHSHGSGADGGTRDPVTNDYFADSIDMPIDMQNIVCVADSGQDGLSSLALGPISPVNGLPVRLSMNNPKNDDYLMEITTQSASNYDDSVSLHPTSEVNGFGGGLYDATNFHLHTANSTLPNNTTSNMTSATTKSATTTQGNTPIQQEDRSVVNQSGTSAPQPFTHLSTSSTSGSVLGTSSSQPPPFNPSLVYSNGHHTLSRPVSLSSQLAYQRQQSLAAAHANATAYAAAHAASSSVQDKAPDIGVRGSEAIVTPLTNSPDSLLITEGPALEHLSVAATSGVRTSAPSTPVRAAERPSLWGKPGLEPGADVFKTLPVGRTTDTLSPTLLGNRHSELVVSPHLSNSDNGSVSGGNMSGSTSPTLVNTSSSSTVSGLSSKSSSDQKILRRMSAPSPGPSPTAGLYTSESSFSRGVFSSKTLATSSSSSVPPSIPASTASKRILTDSGYSDDKNIEGEMCPVPSSTGQTATSSTGQTVPPSLFMRPQLSQIPEHQNHVSSPMDKGKPHGHNSNLFDSSEDTMMSGSNSWSTGTPSRFPPSSPSVGLGGFELGSASPLSRNIAPMTTQNRLLIPPPPLPLGNLSHDSYSSANTTPRAMSTTSPELIKRSLVSNSPFINPYSDSSSSTGRVTVIPSDVRPMVVQPGEKIPLEETPLIVDTYNNGGPESVAVAAVTPTNHPTICTPTSANSGLNSPTAPVRDPPPKPARPARLGTGAEAENARMSFTL